MLSTQTNCLSLVVICLGTTVFAADKIRLEEPVDDTRVFGVGTRVDVTGKTQPSPKVQPLPLTASAVT